MPRVKANSGNENESVVRIIAKIAGTIFVSLLLLGYYAGRQQSPKYDDPSIGPQLLIEFLRRHTFYVIENFIVSRDSQGRLAQLAAGKTSIMFMCDPFVYVYDLESKHVTKRGASLKDASIASWGFAQKAEPTSLDPAVELILGGGAGFSLASMIPKTSELFFIARRANSVTVAAEAMAVGIVSLLSGAGIGYWLAYRATPACVDSKVESLLADDAFWEALAGTYTQYAWKFEWTDHAYFPKTWLQGKMILPVLGNNVPTDKDIEAAEHSNRRPLVAHDASTTRNLICDLTRIEETGLADRIWHVTSARSKNEGMDYEQYKNSCNWVRSSGPPFVDEMSIVYPKDTSMPVEVSESSKTSRVRVDDSAFGNMEPETASSPQPDLLERKSDETYHQ
jgi:hypothetical protein